MKTVSFLNQIGAACVGGLLLLALTARSETASGPGAPGKEGSVSGPGAMGPVLSPPQPAPLAPIPDAASLKGSSPGVLPAKQDLDTQKNLKAKFGKPILDLEETAPPTPVTLSPGAPLSIEVSIAKNSSHRKDGGQEFTSNVAVIKGSAVLTPTQGVVVTKDSRPTTPTTAPKNGGGGTPDILDANDTPQKGADGNPQNEAVPNLSGTGTVGLGSGTLTVSSGVKDAPQNEGANQRWIYSNGKTIMHDIKATNNFDGTYWPWINHYQGVIDSPLKVGDSVRCQNHVGTVKIAKDTVTIDWGDGYVSQISGASQNSGDGKLITLAATGVLDIAPPQKSELTDQLIFLRGPLAQGISNTQTNGNGLPSTGLVPSKTDVVVIKGEATLLPTNAAAVSGVVTKDSWTTKGSARGVAVGDVNGDGRAHQTEDSRISVKQTYQGTTTVDPTTKTEAGMFTIPNSSIAAPKKGEDGTPGIFDRGQGGVLTSYHTAPRPDVGNGKSFTVTTPGILDTKDTPPIDGATIKNPDGSVSVGTVSAAPNTTGGDYSGASSLIPAVQKVREAGKSMSVDKKNGSTGEGTPPPIIALLVGLLLPAHALPPNIGNGDTISYQGHTGTVKIKQGETSVDWGDGSSSLIKAGHSLGSVSLIAHPATGEIGTLAANGSVGSDNHTSTPQKDGSTATYTYGQPVTFTATVPSSSPPTGGPNSSGSSIAPKPASLDIIVTPDPSGTSVFKIAEDESPRPLDRVSFLRGGPGGSGGGSKQAAAPFSMVAKGANGGVLPYAEVKVSDESGKVIGEGTADANGFIQWSPTTAGKFTVSVQRGDESSKNHQYKGIVTLLK